MSECPFWKNTTEWTETVCSADRIPPEQPLVYAIPLLAGSELDSNWGTQMTVIPGKPTMISGRSTNDPIMKFGYYNGNFDIPLESCRTKGYVSDIMYHTLSGNYTHVDNDQFSSKNYDFTETTCPNVASIYKLIDCYCHATGWCGVASRSRPFPSINMDYWVAVNASVADDRFKLLKSSAACSWIESWYTNYSYKLAVVNGKYVRQLARNQHPSYNNYVYMCDDWARTVTYHMWSNSSGGGWTLTNDHANGMNGSTWDFAIGPLFYKDILIEYAYGSAGEQYLSVCTNNGQVFSHFVRTPCKEGWTCDPNSTYVLGASSSRFSSRMAVDPATDTLYALYSGENLSSYRPKELFKSNDWGLTWTWVADLQVRGYDRTLIVSEGDYSTNWSGSGREADIQQIVVMNGYIWILAVYAKVIKNSSYITTNVIARIPVDYVP